MANFFEARGYLTAKQASYWRAAMADGKSRIGIYARQLLEEVEAKQRPKVVVEDVGNREEAMMAEREMQRMEAEHDRDQSRLEEIRKHLARDVMEIAA